MTKNDEEIKTIKQELFEYGIKTDIDLIQQLGIQKEDKNKLFAWIKYQCAYSYREGFENGQEELMHNVRDMLIAWEQYKKANWWDSETIDVEKFLMERFIQEQKIKSVDDITFL